MFQENQCSYNRQECIDRLHGNKILQLILYVIYIHRVKELKGNFIFVLSTVDGWVLFVLSSFRIVSFFSSKKFVRISLFDNVGASKLNLSRFQARARAIAMRHYGDRESPADRIRFTEPEVHVQFFRPTRSCFFLFFDR